MNDEGWDVDMDPVAAAVGVIDAAGDRADLLHLGVVAVGLVGVIAARLCARQMAFALAAMAAGRSDHEEREA